MFNQSNPKDENLSMLSIEELRKKLREAEMRVEAQKRSIKTVGEKGFIPESTNLDISRYKLRHYEEHNKAIEDEINNHLQYNSNK